MQPSADNSKPHTDNRNMHTSAPIDALELLRAATTAEGMPVEWACDYAQLVARRFS